MVAAWIEQTLYRPDSTEDELRRLCMAAKQEGLAAVGVPPVWARFAVTALASSPVAVSVPVGYPLGTHTASVKGLEGRLALEEGASELVVVPNLTAYKTGRHQTFQQEIAYVYRQCTMVNPDACLWALIAVDLLDRAEQEQVVRMVRESKGRAFMLTTHSGAPISPTTVGPFAALLRSGERLGVMGELRTMAEAQPLLELGVTRLATPHGIELARADREGE